MIALHESLGVEVPEQDYAKLSTLNSAVDYRFKTVPWPPRG
jgi:hypothetical protein